MLYYEFCGFYIFFFLNEVKLHIKWSCALVALTLIFPLKKKFIIGENCTDISCPGWFIYVWEKNVSALVNGGVLKAAAVSGVCFKFKTNLNLKFCIVQGGLCHFKVKKIHLFFDFFLLSHWMSFGKQIHQKDSVSNSRVISLPAFSPLSSACGQFDTFGI